ncbi:MAG: hypothetical protein LBP59_09435 [Planctomycetaceae bacterium]|nr:hypothetical protein [Planctomycetaceae bacterium]
MCGIKVYDINKFLYFARCIQIALEIHRFKSVKACRPKARQANVNRKLKYEQFKYTYFRLYELLNLLTT